MCPFTRSQWGGRRVCVYDLAYPKPQSPPPQRARGGAGGRGEEQDSVVFKRDQGQEVQWGLVGGVNL